jgi:hypothetical protein
MKNDHRGAWWLGQAIRASDKVHYHDRKRVSWWKMDLFETRISDARATRFN